MAIDRRVDIEPRTFKLARKEDASGVSGVGVVAYGVFFADRVAVVHWNSVVPSTTVYNDIDDVVKLHGHDGKTELVWI